MSGFKFPDEQDDDKKQDQNTELESKVGDNDDEIEVEIVDDTPEQDRNRPALDREVADPTEDELDEYSAGVKKRISELTHARHDERRAKEALLREKAELERVAKAMMEENRKLKQFVNDGSQQYASTLVEAAEANLDAAKRKYKEAFEAGDADAIVAAQQALIEATTRASQAKNFKPTTLQVEKDEVQTESQPEPKPSQLNERTLRWQARNQWFNAPGHEDMTSFALGVHQKLVNSGVDPRSDEYFEQIDARMKSTFREFFGVEDRPKSGDGSGKKPTTVVAPAARSTGPRKVQLTQTQKALAERFGLTPEQYARELAKLEKQNG